MRRTVRIIIFIALCSAFIDSSAQSRGSKIKKHDLKKLAEMMSGKFNSAAQSLADTNFLNISLVMEPIWTEKDDGHWLYVEQALASAQDRPYRQRVYHLFVSDQFTIVSKVYELPEPQKYIGAWKDKSKLHNLTIANLIDRQGCSIFLKKTGCKKYSGSTPGKECLSTLRGAAYATSVVTISPAKLVSWDQGWNEEDEQVWGATTGGYIFNKLPD